MEPARLAEELKDVLRGEAESIADSCARCGLCLAVCPTYQVTRRLLYSPPERLRVALRTLREKNVSGRDVEALFSCLLCGLCSFACPYHIPVWKIVLAARYEAAKKGMLPKGLHETVENSKTSGHSFTRDAERASKWLREVSTNRIDAPSDYLYVPSPLESLRFPSKALVKTKLFELLGAEYSVTSRVLDIGGNPGVDASRLDVGLALFLKAYEALEEAGARYLVISECGSDVKLAKILVPLVAKEAGVKPSRVLHFYEAVERVLGERYSPGGSGEDTVFTSCNFCRLSLLCPTRLVIERLPRDPPPYTSCCGGGGGLSINLEEWAKKIRRRVSSRRLKSLNGSVVLVPCIKCYTTLREAQLVERVFDKKIMLASEKIYKSLSERKKSVGL